jgi:AcrR family transcriptional regulator
MDNKSPLTSSPKGRGRPAITTEQREEMCERIANTAKHLFQTEGYGQVSMRRIAKEIGCAPMTLYKYYEAKIDILRTLWGNVFEDVFDRLDAIQVGNNSSPERLTAISLAYVQYWIDNQEKYRLVFMADGISQSDVNIFVDNPEIGARFQIFQQVLSRLHKNQLSLEQLKHKQDALICFLHGIAHNKVTISGYAWSTPEDLVSIAVMAVLDR